MAAPSPPRTTTTLAAIGSLASGLFCRDLFPLGYSYEDGQYWDDTAYPLPLGATSAQVTLYYQSTSKEFIEFLRDENTTTSHGQTMYDLWNDNGKCPPEVMRQIQVDLVPTTVPADLNKDFVVDLLDFAIFAEYWGWSMP